MIVGFRKCLSAMTVFAPFTARLPAWVERSAPLGMLQALELVVGFKPEQLAEVAEALRKRKLSPQVGMGRPAD